MVCHIEFSIEQYYIMARERRGSEHALAALPLFASQKTVHQLEAFRVQDRIVASARMGARTYLGGSGPSAC